MNFNYSELKNKNKKIKINHLSFRSHERKMSFSRGHFGTVAKPLNMQKTKNIDPYDLLGKSLNGHMQC